MYGRSFTRRLVALGNTAWIVYRLRKLRQSYEAVGGKPEDQMSFTLLLADVCDHLGLTRVQRFSVLGWMGESFMSEWGDTPVGLAEETESALAGN